MVNSRCIEILSFFAEGNKYEGLQLHDKNFTKEELSELLNADYIIWTGRNPDIYVMSIKGWRYLRDNS